MCARVLSLVCFLCDAHRVYVKGLRYDGRVKGVLTRRLPFEALQQPIRIWFSLQLAAPLFVPSRIQLRGRQLQRLKSRVYVSHTQTPQDEILLLLKGSLQMILFPNLEREFIASASCLTAPPGGESSLRCVDRFRRQVT